MDEVCGAPVLESRLIEGDVDLGKGRRAVLDIDSLRIPNQVLIFSGINSKDKESGTLRPFP